MQPLKNLYVNSSFDSKQLTICKPKEKLGKENIKEIFSSLIRTGQNEKLSSFCEKPLYQCRYFDKLIPEYNIIFISSIDKNTPNSNMNASKNLNIKDIPIPKGNSAYSKGKRFE